MRVYRFSDGRLRLANLFDVLDARLKQIWPYSSDDILGDDPHQAYLDHNEEFSDFKLESMFHYESRKETWAWTYPDDEADYSDIFLLACGSAVLQRYAMPTRKSAPSDREEQSETTEESDLPALKNADAGVGGSGDNVGVDSIETDANAEHLDKHDTNATRLFGKGEHVKNDYLKRILLTSPPQVQSADDEHYEWADYCLNFLEHWQESLAWVVGHLDALEPHGRQAEVPPTSIPVPLPDELWERACPTHITESWFSRRRKIGFSEGSSDTPIWEIFVLHDVSMRLLESVSASDEGSSKSERCRNIVEIEADSARWNVASDVDQSGIPTTAPDGSGCITWTDAAHLCLSANAGLDYHGVLDFLKKSGFSVDSDDTEGEITYVFSKGGKTSRVKESSLQSQLSRIRRSVKKTSHTS